MTPTAHFNMKSIPTDQLIHHLGSVSFRLHMVQAADIVLQHANNCDSGADVSVIHCPESILEL